MLHTKLEVFITLMAFGVSFIQLWLLFRLHIFKGEGLGIKGISDVVPTTPPEIPNNKERGKECWGNPHSSLFLKLALVDCNKSSALDSGYGKVMVVMTPPYLYALALCWLHPQYLDPSATLA